MPKPTKLELYNNMKEAIDKAQSRISYLKIIMKTMEENREFIDIVGPNEFLISLINLE